MKKIILQFLLVFLLVNFSSFAANDQTNMSLSQVRSSQIFENLMISDRAGVDLIIYVNPSWFQAAKLVFSDVTSYLMLKIFNMDDFEVKSDKTALYIASEMRHAHIVDLLLKGGACVYKTTNTPLKLAAYYGHIDTVKTVLKYNVKPYQNIKALRYAIMGGHLIIMKSLLGAGFDINAKGGSWDNSTALHVAAEYRQHEAFKILKENEPKLDPLYDGHTPLAVGS